METKNDSQIKISKVLANRLRIEGALMVGSSINQICKILNVCKKTVRGVIKNGFIGRKDQILEKQKLPQNLRIGK